MSSNDLLSDMLTRIRNGQRANLAHVNSPSSKLLKGVLEVLKNDGYIRDYSQEEINGKPSLRIELKYYDGEPVIKTLKRVSKPGRRLYSKIGDMFKVHNGLGISILSTSKGVMSDHDARNQNVGGEVLCSVF